MIDDLVDLWIVSVDGMVKCFFCVCNFVIEDMFEYKDYVCVVVVMDVWVIIVGCDENVKVWDCVFGKL